MTLVRYAAPTALILLVAPLAPTVSTAVAAVAALALTLSFASDVAWLARHARRA